MRLQLFDILGGLFGAGVILFLLFTLNDPPALPQVSGEILFVSLDYDTIFNHKV